MVQFIQSWAHSKSHTGRKNRNASRHSRYFSMNLLVEVCSYKTFEKILVTNTFVKMKRLNHLSVATVSHLFTLG